MYSFDDETGCRCILANKKAGPHLMIRGRIMRNSSFDVKFTK